MKDFSNTTSTHSSNKILDENMMIGELQRELVDTKEKLKLMTAKFTAVRKERDQLKTETKDLQQEILTLQNSMRQMVPCPNNTSQSFPMYNELTHRVSELFKCDCQDVFFDLLSPELNLDGVVFFFANVYTSIFKAIQKHFQPAENAIRQLVRGPLDGPLESVLRKSYQTNWRQIHAECLDRKFSQSVADDLQSTLSIQDSDPAATEQIRKFVQQASEVCFLMAISDPPLCFDLQSIGQKVAYSQFKFETLDGFVKQDESCLIILPSVHKQMPASQGGLLGEVVVKANVLPVTYEFS